MRPWVANEFIHFTMYSLQQGKTTSIYFIQVRDLLVLGAVNFQIVLVEQELLKGINTVLEIGTGTGVLSCVICNIAKAGKKFSTLSVFKQKVLWLKNISSSWICWCVIFYEDFIIHSSFSLHFRWWTTERKRIRVTATDTLDEAIECTKWNAANLGFKISAVKADVFPQLEKKVQHDLIIANPPYIPCKPVTALDNGNYHLSEYSIYWCL